MDASSVDRDASRQIMPGCGDCQSRAITCNRNVRSSSLCKVESSALIGHGGSTRGTVDVSKRAGSAEGAARSQEAAHHPEAGRGGVGNQRALGADLGEAAAARRRQRPATQAAGAAFEPEDAGGSKATSAGVVPAEATGQAVA